MIVHACIQLQQLVIILVVFIGVVSINIIGWDISLPLLVTPAQLMRPVRILVFAEACRVQWVTFFFCITSKSVYFVGRCGSLSIHIITMGLNMDAYCTILYFV